MLSEKRFLALCRKEQGEKQPKGKPPVRVQRVVRVRTVDELTRLAFLWAEQDREALADAWPPKSEERTDAETDAKELRQYRLKRWGKTKHEAFMNTPGKSVNLLTLKHSNSEIRRVADNPAPPNL